MHIGLDFGTTNSGAAVYDGRQVHAFSLDPHSRDPTVMRSALYITREHETYIGQEAIDVYYQQNIGRPSRMSRQWVGEIELTVGDVGTRKGYPIGPTTFVRDVYTLVDELMPGRLLRSLKSGLATPHEGTTLFGRFYELEDLIAVYLRQIRERVEAEAGERVEGVVMGRPVHFEGSSGRQAAYDQRAEERLRRAALAAGYPEVRFELEPVAAALHYERRLGETEQNVLVFDFGGGTLDITVARVGGSRAARVGGRGTGRAGAQGARKVYATGGLAIAGDTFDTAIIEGLLLDHFGRGTTWGEDAAPFPDHYTDALVQWQTIPELGRPETIRFLQTAQATSNHPDRLRALESLLTHNYAVHMVDEVEGAKVELSTSPFSQIRLNGENLDLWQPITRSQFETLIAGHARQIQACLLDTVERSGLRRDEIDAVVRTGGSAQIPLFVAMLERLFGAERVVEADVFNSVTAGLAIRASLARF
jgi:hypothetical chaperone protein